MLAASKVKAFSAQGNPARPLGNTPKARNVFWICCVIVRGVLACAGVSSNIVTFPAHRRVATPLWNTGEAAQRFLDVPEPGAAQDSRPILLFDLNGTLTSHTAARRSAGINLMRPGIHHLMKLQVRSIHLVRACQYCMYCHGWPSHTEACRSAGVSLMHSGVHHPMQLHVGPHGLPDVHPGPRKYVQPLSTYSSRYKCSWVTLQPMAIDNMLFSALACHGRTVCVLVAQAYACNCTCEAAQGTRRCPCDV